VDYGSLGVDSSSFIGDISNISLISISLVANMLDTAIRKSNRVRSLSIASTITSLSSVESSLGVVISNSIGIGVGRRLIRVGWLSIALHHRGMVGRGSVHHRGMISWGSMDNRGMVDNWSSMDSMNNWGSMNKWSMMDNRSMDSMVEAMMSNRSMNGMVDSMVDTMVSNRDDGGMSNSNRPVSTNGRLYLRKTLGIVYLRDRGVGSSESLGLNNTSLLSIRPGH